LSFLILDGCNKSNPVESNNLTQSIVPLAVGNSWTVLVTYYDTLGPTQVHSEEVFKVYGDTTILSKQFFTYNGFPCANTDSGLVMYTGYSVSSTASYHLLYKYPTYSGDSFDDSMEVTSIDTLISVPAGAFHCIKYQDYSSGIRFEDDYISPGIGIIKIVDYAMLHTNNSLQIEFSRELETYTLK
jgi:hypothetical protein